MKQLLRLGLALFLLLTLPRFAFAQYNPNLQFNAGNPRGLNTTTDTATVGWLAITAGSEATNSWSAVQSIPFSFNFYGNPVTALKVSRNGLLTFNTGTAMLPSSNLDLPTNVLPDKTIACFWDQFSAAPPLPPNARIYTRTFGAAGSRQLWIKWVNYEIGNPVCAFANFACVLEEGTNKVYMVDMNYSSPANVTATIGLQNTSAQAIQFGSSTFPFFSTNSGPTVADNDYYEFTPQITGDAGIASIDAPTVPFGSGISNVVVTLKNFSQSVLSNVTIKWKVNNVAQPDFTYNGSINSNATASVTIGSYNFVDGFTYNIEAETMNPNGSSDINSGNDKVSKSVCPMLLGNYVIGGTSGDFNTLTEAVNLLHCAGVETAVKFTLAPGTGPYNEQITLNSIQGASALNTITFDGGSTQEKLTSTGAHTIQLNGADYIILQNLTIENLAASTGANVLLVNGANNNIIRNNYFPIKASTAFNNPFTGVVIGAAGPTGLPNNGSFNLIQNNVFENGSGAIIMRATSAGLDNQNRIVGNTIINAGTQGILSAYQKMPYIQNNIIQFTTGSNNTTGIQSDFNDNFEISGNIIRNPSSRGIYINNGNNLTGGMNSRAKIINNMIISLPGSFCDGISFGTNSTFIDIFHNSVSINGGSGDGISIFSGSSIAIKNNSLALFNPTNTFSRAFYGGGTAITYAGFDHNNFYSSAGGNIIRVNNTDLSQANFQGFGGYNTNSTFGNPGYLDPASDLHAITAQLNNKGDNSVNVTTDIDGQARPATAGGLVDIGADEFTIFPNDIGLTSLVAPMVNGRVLTSKALTSTESVTIKLTNSGGTALSNIPVYYTLNGVTSAQELVPGPIAPGASTNYTFTAKANMAAVGTYTLKAYAAFATDDDRSNDTLATSQIKQLPNAAVTFPLAEDFENTAGLVLGSNYVGLEGAERFDYETTFDGRLRSFAGTGFAKSGLKAITLDRSNFGANKPVNYLLMTMNLTGLTTADVLMLDFAYAFHSNFGTDDVNNRVWVRGNDTAPWVQLYDLFANKIGAGSYKPVTNMNISAALAAAGQTFSSSTQIRFGQSGTNRATSNTCCDGFSFDDIAVRKLLQTDLGVTALIQPVANSCGDSAQTVEVRVKNFGVASKTNIPVIVKISGPVNTTLTGILAGPLATDQTATLNLGTINTYNGGLFTFKAYANMVGEEDRRNDTLATTVFINAIPVMPTALSAAGCEGEPITIGVQGSADSYNFFSASSGGNALSNSVTGSFSTPPLTSTTTYYASAVNSTAAEVGAKTDAIGLGGSVNQFNAGLEFNVLRTLILDSVFVYPASAGNVKINLLNASGAIIATKTVVVTTPNVKTPVPLNFKIAPGNNYKLDAQGSTVTALFRNTNGAVYPYQIPQALSITGGTFGVGPFYYFFYDWQVTILECESERVPVIATVNPKPVVNLGTDIKSCNGLPVMLDAGNAGSGFAYLWSQGSTSQTVNVATSGKYYVRVTNPITGCFSVDTINVSIGTSPAVNLGNDIVQCAGVVTLDAGNAGTGFNYLWSNGSATQTIGVNASGTYSVTVTNPATGCSSTDQIQVTFNPKPVVNLGTDKTQCEGTVTLDAGNSGSGFTYLWSNGATTQTAAITASGTYNVKVTNPATGCFSTDTINVTINTKPVVNLGPAIIQCGGTATLDAGNVGYTYLWSNGVTTRTITASTSGMYSVTVTNPITNCSNTGQVQVTINAVPTVNLGADQTQCGGTIALDAGNAGLGYTYLWSTGATTKTIAASATGKYWARVTNPTGNCVATDTVNVTFNALPTATVSANKGTTICQGDSIILTASAGSSWLWSNGATMQSIKVKAGGNYSVTVTNANNCAATSAPTSITVTPLPVISLANQAICTGQSATLTVTPQTGVTYAWSGGQTGNSITVSPTATTTYTVTATSAGGCINTQAVTVTVNSLPTVNAGIDTATCANTPITLTATGTGTSFTWSNGQSGSSITVSPSATTTYTVTTTNGNNCTATDQVLVTVRTSPATPTISAAGGVLTSSAATGNQWYLNGTLIPGETGQNYTPTANGNYTVIVTLGQCTATSAAFAYAINGMADEALNAQLQVYPNPTSGNFEVKLNNQHKPVMLTLYNLTGQLLTKVEVKPNTAKTLTHTFDLTSFAQGIYVLKLETEGKTVFRKVVKE